MARGIPDCPTLNPKHDGFGAAKIFTGHPYETEEGYSVTETVYHSNPNTSIRIENLDDEDDDDDYEEESSSLTSGYNVNINIQVNASDGIGMQNVLKLIKAIHTLNNTTK